MAKIDFGGMVEDVVTRDEFPLEKAREVLSDEVVAVLGYGVQGPAQALNMRDNGINVIVGGAPERKRSWEKARQDGWQPGKTLFPFEEATERATIIQYLVSDAGQMHLWPRIKPCLKEGDALYFSHGFAIVYNDQTGIVPPEFVDVILVAPKGSGRSVRANFLAGSGINSSYAVYQDYTGRATERVIADPEPNPAGGRERHGLDVRQLQHDGAAGRARLAPQVPRGGHPCFRGTV